MVRGIYSIEAVLFMLILTSSMVFIYSMLPKFYFFNFFRDSDEYVKFISLLISIDEIGLLDEICISRDYMKLYSLLKSCFNGDLKIIIFDAFSGFTIYQYPEDINFPIKLCYYFYSSISNRLFIIVLGWKY
ncbi:MAG: hypothetical protein QW743_05105 [Candidatus Methanomethylicia archaeon]